jgi:two-component system sensor histidine kinase RpfC
MIAPGTLAGLVARARAHGNGDLEMVVNRQIAAVLFVAVYLFVFGGRLNGDRLPLLAAGIYFGAGLLIALHLVTSSGKPTLRRAAALCLDMGVLALEMDHGGTGTAWMYPIYLWIIFGNGFRFGSQFLLLATLVATVSFGATVVLSPFWRAAPQLSVGLLLGLIALPLYARTLIRKLSLALEAAEAANQAKSMFLAAVSHDLRTPLNAIIGMGALLSRGRLDAEQRDMSQTIMLAARNLLASIDGILDLSRIEAGKMPQHVVDFDLAEFVAQLRRMVIAQAAAKSLYVGLHVSAQMPLLLTGDDRRLRDILLNLLTNAIKFTKSGGVMLTIAPVSSGEDLARLRFEVADTGMGIAENAREKIFESFVQADETILDRFGGTGLGLSITRQSVRLLGGDIGVESTVGVGSTFWVELPFANRHAPVAEEPRFDGMQALLACKDPAPIAPLLGRLSACGLQIDRLDPITARRLLPEPLPSGNPDGLLVFLAPDSQRDPAAGASHADLPLVALFARPVAAPLDPALRRRVLTLLAPGMGDESAARALSLVRSRLRAQQEVSAAATPLPITRRSLHIVAADDNASNRKVLSKILENAGHTVSMFEDGDAALDDMTEQNFDLAILDVNMPGMNGIDVVKHYRMASIGERRLPIIGLTADVTPQTRQRCMDAGMDACLTKPIDPADLCATIDAVAEKAELAAGRGAAASVAAISEHPKFRSASAPAIDARIIKGLVELAGPEFLADVIKDYLDETYQCLRRMREAAAGDVGAFRALVHSLRSSAANVGALELGKICRPWETVSADDLAQSGEAFLTRIEAEVHRVQAALHATGDKGAARK